MMEDPRVLGVGGRSAVIFWTESFLASVWAPGLTGAKVKSNHQHWDNFSFAFYILSTSSLRRAVVNTTALCKGMALNPRKGNSA